MAVLSPWAPPWRSVSALPSQAATDAEVAAAVAGNNLSGLLVDRPAFGTAGRQFFATDEGVLYRDTGSAWVRVSLAGGEERALSSKSDANFVAAASAVRLITGLDPITFDVQAGEVAYVRLKLPWNTHDSLAGTLIGNIYDGGSTLKESSQSPAAYAASRSVGPMMVEERIATPGSYTRVAYTQTFTGNVTSVCSATVRITLGAYIFR